MGEKRFHMERDSTGTFTFFYDGKHRMYDEEVVNLLNEQTGENQKLTKERNRYKGQIKQKNDKIERLQRENNNLQVHYKYDVKHLKEENDKLKGLIKGNVFGRYREGSLADLEFKAIAYDDIVKLEMSYESEPKVIVICRQGKKENVKSFCQMFIPFGVHYEIKEVIE